MDAYSEKAKPDLSKHPIIVIATLIFVALGAYAALVSAGIIDNPRTTIPETPITLSSTTKNETTTVRQTTAKQTTTTKTTAFVGILATDPTPTAFDAVHVYKVFDTMSLNWKQAQEYCESLNGHLATITSRKEQEYINSIIKDNKKRSLWIGLTDERIDGVWKWVTGEPFFYANWGYDEPNNGYGGSEHYVALVTRDTRFNYEILLGQWNDHSLNRDLDAFGFICEWDSVEEYEKSLS